MARLQRTALITVGCVSVIAGLGLARRMSWDSWYLVLLIVPLAAWRRRAARVALIILIGLLLGVLQGSNYMQKLHGLQQLTGQKVTIQVSATSDAVYAQKSQMEFIGNNAKLYPSGKLLAGNFKISGFGVPMVQRGDVVKVSGKLFPMRGSNQARIAYAQLKLISKDSSWIHALTRNFAAGMQTALPEPEASFGLGLLIGQRTSLPQDILAQLTAVGLVHIVAVSGYNVTILAQAAAGLKLRSKFQQLVLSLSFIALFIMITGFSASIVRAAIVSVLSLWAWYYGLKFKPTVLIAFTAALTGTINPFYVWTDLGWYLSFLAFLGVLVIAPIISRRLFSKPPKLYTQVLIETLSAEIMTLPLIMMTFGQLSSIALLANLLIVPLVPVAMLLCAVAGIAGMYLLPVVGWLAWPAVSLLTFMLDVVHMLASFPMALLHINISPAFMAGLYSLFLLLVLIMSRQIRNKKHPNWVLPNQ
jgi:competence protein ComEC